MRFEEGGEDEGGERIKKKVWLLWEGAGGVWAEK